MQVLVTIKDRFGTDVVIKKENAIGESPLMELFLADYLKEMKMGRTTTGLPLGNSSSVIWAEIDNNIVGYIAYELREENKTKYTWICYGKVNENFQKRGLYGILHDVLEHISVNNGSVKIMSMVHVDNAEMISLGKKLGKEFPFYRSVKTLSGKK